MTDSASADRIADAPTAPERSPVSRALAWWTPRRLQLGPLPPAARAAGVAGLVVTAAMAFLLFAKPLGLELPGGVSLTSDLARMPRAVLIGAYLALGATAGCLAMTLRLRRGVGAGARAGIAAIGVAGAALAATGVSAIAPLANAAALIGVAVGLGLAVAAVIDRLPDIGAVGLWAAAPPALAVVAYLLPVTGPFAVPFGIIQQDVVGQRMALMATNLTAPVVLLGTWGAIEYARSLVRSSMRITRRSRALRVVVVGGLLVAKLVWLALAHLRIAPPELGGHEDFVGPSPLGAPVAWALALAIGGLVAGWLLGRRQLVAAPRGAVAAAWVVGIGLVAGLALVQLALIALQVWLMVTSATEVPALLRAILDFAAVEQIWIPAVTVVAAGIGGVLLLADGRRPAGLFLLGTFVWALPRVLGVVSETVTGVRLEEPAGTPLGIIDPATLDAAISIGILAALAVAVARRQRPPVRAAAVIAMVSTTLAYAPRLISAELAIIVFWASFVFPIIVRLAFDAEPLNRARGGRTGRVLAVIGTAAGSLGLAALLAWTGDLAPDGATLEELGSLIMLVPVTALFLAAALAVPPRRPPAPG